MLEPCAACGDERNDHYRGQDGIGHCIGCQAIGNDCQNFVKTTRGD